MSWESLVGIPFRWALKLHHLSTIMSWSLLSFASVNSLLSFKVQWKLFICAMVSMMLTLKPYSLQKSKCIEAPNYQRRVDVLDEGKWCHLKSQSLVQRGVVDSPFAKRNVALNYLIWLDWGNLMSNYSTNWKNENFFAKFHVRSDVTWFLETVQDIISNVTIW